MELKVKLKIADIIIQIENKSEPDLFKKKEQKVQIPRWSNNFVYKGKAKPDIVIKMIIVDKLPKVEETQNIFITYHFTEHRENWRLIKKSRSYIYNSPIGQQTMFINKAFDRVTAYLLSKKDKDWSQYITAIVYDFLQVLLINYFALNKKGIFVHSIGMKDLGGKGLLFAGKSGAGKSTAARLWYKHSRVMVLNDDRIIVRRLNGKFLIYGSPWNGEFNDYLKSHIESAPLDKLFFIYHASQNTIQHISKKQAFSLLYPAIFPTFWDKARLENVVSFCQDLVKDISCFKLGFVNDKSIIKFVRKI